MPQNYETQASRTHDGDTTDGGILDLMLDMELPLTLRFASTKLLLGDVARLRVGSSVEFLGAPDRQVEILVNGRVVGRGEPVVVNGNYGIRISKVLDQASSPNPIKSAKKSKQ